MKNKILSFVLSIILVVSSFVTVVVASNDANIKENLQSAIYEPTPINNNYNKIHFYFDNEEHSTIDNLNELKEATSELSQSINSNNLRNTGRKITEDTISIIIELKSEFMETEQYHVLLSEHDSQKDGGDTYNFRTKLNAYSKEYHKALFESNLENLNSIDYISVNQIDYSPFVVMNISKSNITNEALMDLASKEVIEHITLSEVTIGNSADDSLNDFLVEPITYSTENRSTYTGSGIRIGIYESGGVCNKNNPNLVGKDIEVRDLPYNYQNDAQYSDGTSDHATAITTAIALSVPDAKFYVSMIGDYDGDGKKDIGLDWFISKRCDVINCSFGFFFNVGHRDEETGITTYTNVNNGYREGYDSLYDYQIMAHKLTVVCSAGNLIDDNTDYKYNPDAQITSPGYAYNAITVGGIARVELSGTEVIMHYPSACFVSNYVKGKPNVSDSYFITLPNGMGTWSGTSFATAQVTSKVAMLIDYDSDYCEEPEMIRAIISVTADKTTGYVGGQGLDNKVGAGVINFNKMLNYATNIHYVNRNTEAHTEVISEEIVLDKGYEFGAAASWISYVERSINDDGEYEYELQNTDYDLHIYNYEGDLVYSSALTASSVELIRFTVSETDSYRIVVYQFSPMAASNYEDHIALSYYIDPN